MGLKSFLFGKSVCEMVEEVEEQREEEKKKEQPQESCDECGAEGYAPVMHYEDCKGRTAQPSLVSHPPHYNSGKIEVIEAIEDWGLNFHKGNTVKYVARAGKKNPEKEIQDLEKAAWYLNREIELLKSKKESRDPVRPNDMVKR